MFSSSCDVLSVRTTQMVKRVGSENERVQMICYEKKPHLFYLSLRSFFSAILCFLSLIFLTAGLLVELLLLDHPQGDPDLLLDLSTLLDLELW